MIRFLDFVLTGLAILAICSWNDGNKVHLWTTVALVGSASIMSYIRGLKGK